LAVSLIDKTSVIPFSISIALLAADLSLKHILPMADATVYGAVLEKNCKVVTSNIHFKGLERVVLVN
jgi:toxin FitB